MINIVIPMAGRGSRFAAAGYSKPKPMIDVLGKPMIQVVVENLTPDRDHRFVFICQNEHIKEFGLEEFLTSIAPGCAVVGIDGITDGAACTVLLAEEHIDNDTPMMMANSDQWVDTDVNAYLADWDARGSDGHIMTMTSQDPKWSYIKYDADGQMESVVEKVVVSEDATVGIYNFRRGSDFVKYAKQMVAEDNRSKGEFYVAPVYDYMIRAGQTVTSWSIGSDQEGMYGLGTPDDLDFFLSHPVSKRV